MCQRNKYDSPTHGCVHLRAEQSGKTRFNIRLNRKKKKRMFQILISRFFDSWCLFISSQFLWQQMTTAKNKQIHRYRHMCTQRSLIYRHAYNHNLRPEHFHTYRQPKWSSLLISSLVSCIVFLGRILLILILFFVQCLIPWLSLFVWFQIGITCDERAYLQFGVFHLANMWCYLFFFSFSAFYCTEHRVHSECAEGAIIRK